MGGVPHWLPAVIEFQLSYSRSWKMMLWKVLHSICNMQYALNMLYADSRQYGNLASTRVEEGLSRSFSGWGGKPWGPSTCAWARLKARGEGDDRGLNGHKFDSRSWWWTGRPGAETPILWPLDVKSRLIEKDPGAGKYWKQKEKGVAEDKMVREHHWLNGHESEQTLGDSEGQGSLAYCSPWGCKDSDMT